ncbi:MAG: acetyl-CoA carboxylase biotin carboxyl carrier protein [Tunicatimonas sp.]
MDYHEIQSLLDFIAKSGLEEVKIETEELTLKVKKSMPAKVHQNIIQAPGATMPHDSTGLVAAAPASALPSAASEKAPESADAGSSASGKNGYIPITSPMIGTFYQASSPESDPFVKVGDRVSTGKTVCVIEAMKLFNEIESEISGTVVEILVDDASPVQYDQPLFLVDPA